MMVVMAVVVVMPWGGARGTGHKGDCHQAQQYCEKLGTP
jgi:hypothetical protein